MMMMMMMMVMVVTGGDDGRFLVSFVVDARGAVMLGRRHSGLRFIIPPSATSHPTRVRCKLVSASKLSCPPPLTEADALAARVIDLGQTRVKFDRLAHPPTPMSTLFVYLSVSLSVAKKVKVSVFILALFL